MENELIKKFRKKTVAISGASGYIGSMLADKIRENSQDVICVSRTEKNYDSNFLKHDLSNYDDCKRIVKKADIIYLLGGNTSIYEAKKNPKESINTTVLPISQIVRSATNLNKKIRVVFTSTATVYGLTKNNPISERITPRPITAYDLHKLFAEQEIEMAVRKGILEGFSLRLANVYGPSKTISSSRDRGVLNKSIINGFINNELLLYDNGDCIRDYIYITDVIDALILAGIMPASESGIFNVGSGVGSTIKNAFNLVSKEINILTKKRIKIISTPWPDYIDQIEKRSFTANINKLKKFGWSPKIKIEEGINLACSKFLKELI